MPRLNGWTSIRSMNWETSGGRWPGIGGAMVGIRYAFWQTISTAAARRWPFCKEHGIRLSSSTKPPKDSLLSRQAKKRKYQDNCDYDIVEDIFGTSKTTYGLGRIIAHLQETIVCVIGVTLLLLNLPRFLRTAFALFCLLSVVAVLPGSRSRA